MTLRKRLGLAAAAIVLVFGVAWAVLAILFPPDKLRALVRRQLAISLVRDVRFERVGIGLWPPVRLAVGGPALAEPGGFGQGTMFRARAIDLDLDLFALLRNRFVVRRLVLQQPELHVLLRADGTTNLDGIGRPPGAQPPRVPRPMDLSVRRLVIHRGRVLVDDVKAARRVTLGMESSLAFDVKRSAQIATHGETELDGLAFGPLSAARLTDLDRSLAKLRWRLRHRGTYDAGQKHLALETLALELGRTRLALSGWVQDPGPHPAFDLVARGRGVDVGEILGFLAKADARTLNGIHGQGMLDFDLGFRGAGGGAPAGAGRAAFAAPRVIGTLRLANGGIEYPGAPAKVEALEFHARFAPDSLTIDDLSARMAGQPFRARIGVASFADPHVAFAARGNVDLAAIAPLLTAKDGSISGRADVNVAGAGRAKDPGALAIQGQVKLAHVRVVQPSLPKPIENLEGTIGFSRTRATVSGLSAKAGGSHFMLDATVDRPLALMASRGAPHPPAPAAVGFRFQAPRLDLADLMPQGGGAVELPNASGSGGVAIGKFIDDRLELDNVSATVQLARDALTVPAFRAAAYGGIASGSARVDLSRPTAPRVETKSRLDSVRVEQLLKAFIPPGNWLNGSFGTSIDLETELPDPRRTLTASGLASLLNGTLEHSPVLERIAEFAKVPSFRRLRIHDLESTFRIAQGRVFTGPATFHGPEGDWIWSGSAGLDGTLDYAVSVTVPPSIAQQIGARAALAAGALSDDQGRLLMDFRVTGSVTEPRIAWDPGAMKARLQGRASAALEQQKQKFESTVRDSVSKQVHAAQDSARAAAERARRALEDSLKRKGRGVLEGFFKRGATPSDTTPH